MLNTKKDKKDRKTDEKKPQRGLLFATQILLCIILAITAGYYIYINRYHSAINNLLGGNLTNLRAKKPFSLTLDPSQDYRFKVYKENILLCNRDGVKALNKSGQEEWSITMNLSDPIIETNNKYIVIADKGGREINLVTNYSVVCTKRTEEPIIMLRVNRNGYFAAVTQEKGYKGKVTVFNPEGQEIYKWYSVDNYITDLDISNDGKKLAISTIDLSKGIVSGGIAFFNLNEEKPYAGIVIEGTLISNIKFYRDNSLVGVGDNQMIGFSPQGLQQWNIDYKDRDLYIYNLNSDEIIALGLSHQKGTGFLSSDNVVEIYDINGKIKGEYEIKGEIKYLDVENDLIALNKKRDICVITAKGDEIAQATSSKDIKDIILFKNKRDILVVSRNTLEILELKRN